MSSPNFESQWAQAMQKSRQQQARQKTNTPLAIREKQIKEEMDYFKQKLLRAGTDSNKKEVQKIVDILIKIRARQSVLKLQKLQENFGFITDFNVKKIVKKYLTDCRRLLKLTDQ